MNNIGVVGYNISKTRSGAFLQQMRKELEIKPFLAIFNYRHNGFEAGEDFDMFVNGAPEDLQNGRWGWEVDPHMLKFWKDHYSLKGIVLVGSDFGRRTVHYAHMMKLKIAIVTLWDDKPANVFTGHRADLYLVPRTASDVLAQDLSNFNVVLTDDLPDTDWSKMRETLDGFIG